MSAQRALFNVETPADADDMRAYNARHAAGALVPGERCPACGHTFVNGGHDGSRDHAIMSAPGTEVLCMGMVLDRRHADRAEATA